MGQLLVRGLDESLIQALKRWAKRVGRSVEAEHRAVSEAALSQETESFAEMAEKLCTRTPLSATDSADLVRADRDRDHGERT